MDSTGAPHGPEGEIVSPLTVRRRVFAGQRAADGAEEARSLRLRYQELFEFASEGYVVTDLSGIILEANHAAAALLGRSKEFLLGKPLGLFIAAGHRNQFYAWLAGSVHGSVLETRIGGSQKEARDVVLIATSLAEHDGRATTYRWLLRDVSAMRQTERNLLLERQLLDSIIDTVDSLILVVASDGRILRSNAYLHAVSGYAPDELDGMVWFDLLLDPDDRLAGRKLTAEAATEGMGRGGVLRFQGKGAERRDVSWSARGQDTGDVVLLGHDITDLLEAQRQKLQAERLVAIGQVAAGLAHESRNALQRSQACLSLLTFRLRDHPEALDLVQRAQQAQDDLHRLYEDVRSFAAPIRLERTKCSLAEVWRSAWADQAWKPGWEAAELHEDVEGVELTCRADPFQLKRVFSNLMENAFAAAPPPLRLKIKCEGARLAEKDAVRLHVRDNGPGLAPELRMKAFEPFFTTKTRGTGLGLAICRRIIEGHGGRVDATHDGAAGEFIILLPTGMP